MKKTILAFALLAAFSAACAALPGVEQYLRDVSGEYVYYEDFTFARESYVGFLFYDEGACAARYFAPSIKEKNLAARAVEIYFTINPSANHLEFTGEKIVGGRDDEDTQIVNYIHDLMYELCARRAKVGCVSPNSEATVFTGEYAQFGGDVSIEYDWLVPMFNVKSITSNQNKTLLSVVTTGALKSSDDKSFASFNGIPRKHDEPKRKFKLRKKSKETVCQADGIEFALDEQWKNAPGGLWLLGDAAIVSTAAISAPLDGAALDGIARRLLQSAGRSYMNWRDVSARVEGGCARVEGAAWQGDSGDMMRVFRVAVKTTDGGAYFSLTLFDSIYQANRSYFDALARQVK